MLLGARTAAWSKSLPYDAEVVYLIGDGSSYIDTGVIAKNTVRVKIRFRRSYRTKIQGAILGCRAANNARYEIFVTAYSNGVRINLYNSTYGGASYLPDDTKINEVDVNPKDGYVNLNGSEIECDVQEYTSMSLLLLCQRNDMGLATTSFSKYCEIYGVEIWDNDIILRNLIPVRVGNVGYMYDRVSKTLFGNAGTGAFIVGPDV